MDTPEGAQEGAQPRACPFTGVTVDFADAIAIVVACPLVLPMIDRGMGQSEAMVTAVFIGVDHRRGTRDRFTENALAGCRIAMADHPAAFFARVATNDVNNWRTIIGVGAVARLFVRPTAWWVVWIAMGRAFFSPRSGRSHQPQTSARPSHP